MTAISSRHVEATAGKGEQLTKADLRAFLQSLDDAGAAESTPISGRVSPRGKLRQLSASAIRFGDR